MDLMKLVLEKYVFKEVATPFALAMLVMVIIMLIQRMIQITEWVVNRGVPLLRVFQMVCLMLPFFLTIVTPVALLLATLLVVNRLSADSEITVMKAVGISIARLLAPVLVLGVLCTVMTAFLSLYAIPRAAEWTNEMKLEIARTSVRAAIKLKGFVNLGSNLTIYVDAMENETLKGVMIAQTQTEKEKIEGTETVYVFAKQGRMDLDPEHLKNNLQLTDGEIQTSDRNGKIFRSIKFDVFDVKIDLEEKKQGGKVERGSHIELMNIADLDRKKEDLSKRLREVQSSKPQTKATRLAAERYRVALRQIEISRYQKFSLPFACLILALWGIPLGIQPPRTTRHQGIITSIALTMIYYIMVSGGKMMAVKGFMPPFWALWGPNVIVVLSGIFFFHRVLNDRPLPTSVAATWVAEWVARFVDRFQRESRQ